MIERLLETLAARGLRVMPGPEPGQLVLSGPMREKTELVMESVKAFKPELMEYLSGACKFCGSPRAREELGRVFFECGTIREIEEWWQVWGCVERARGPRS